MKIIPRKIDCESIRTDQLTNDHIIVAIIEGNACILSRKTYGTDGILQFKIIGTNACGILTAGNGYTLSGDRSSIADEVETVMDFDGFKSAAAFNKKDWKEALQWLIDNG